MPCEYCATTPKGIEGHPLLTMGNEKPRTATFVCSACGTRWVRIYEGEGHFRWEQVATA